HRRIFVVPALFNEKASGECIVLTVDFHGHCCFMLGIVSVPPASVLSERLATQTFIEIDSFDFYASLRVDFEDLFQIPLKPAEKDPCGCKIDKIDKQISVVSSSLQYQF
ncbi:hypothetical protein V5O48_019739, partial [Marasmius crinis-equi]